MSSETEDRYVQKIIAETIERREAGETLSDADVLAAHPEHAELLRINLERLQIITRAQQLADDASSGETFTPDTIGAGIPRTLIHCPACESRWKLSSGLTQCPTCGMELKPVSENGPHPGQQIRHYVLVEQIGSGGFGTVWRARDSKLECDVAIKIPRQEKLSTDEIERFIREARVSAQLRKHPNIVSVHEADWEDATAYIASDYIEGVSLGDRLEHSTIPRESTIDLVMTICDALHHAHEAGIVHRDLKPDNILLDINDVPHVTDFGLAKREDQLIASDAGQIMGTAAYMSPEQAQGASDQADRRSDVFSLGVVLYEMLTGERPFRGSVPRTLRQIIDQDPPRLTAFDSRIPLDLETICLKCLEKDPELRYLTMEELKADLQRFQKHQPILARPIGTAGKLWRWCKRNPVIPWLSLALILVTLGAMVSAGIMLDRYVDNMQTEVRNRTERTLEVMTANVTDEFKKILHERIEDVLEMSEDEEIYDALATWKTLDATTKSNQLKTLKENAKRNANNPKAITFPKEIKPVQEALENFHDELIGRNELIDRKIDGDKTSNQKSQDAKPYSWFITDMNGSQIARVVKKKTLGTDFGYRSYFTGLMHDLRSKESEPSPPSDIWVDPKFSDIFVTDTEEACVIAISTPIREKQNGHLLGVVGIFVELGKFIEIPSNERQTTTHGNDRNMVTMAIYDAREDRGRSQDAILVHHPMLKDDLDPKLSPEERMTNTIPPVDELLPSVDLELKAPPDLPSKLHRLSNYHDPLTDVDQTDEWLAVRTSEPIGDGLYVVIQMPMSAIEAPGKHLRTNLILLGFSVVGLSAAILIPMWIIVLRRVIKE